MGQGKCPETKIRSSVWNSTKYKLNSFNHLMNKSFSEGVTMIMLTHCLNLILKWFHFSLSLLHNIFWITTDSLDLVVCLFLIVDVCKFNFVICIWWWSTSEAAWFHEQHYWNADDHEDKENGTDLEFLGLVFTNVGIHFWVFWFGATEVEH